MTGRVDITHCLILVMLLFAQLVPSMSSDGQQIGGGNNFIAHKDDRQKVFSTTLLVMT